MVIMGQPQFETQNDLGIGDGIPPIPEWQLEPADNNKLDNELPIDPTVSNVFNRLRNVFHRARTIPFSSTQLHDLTCFVIHRLLAPTDPLSSYEPTSECIRFAIILYMLTIHGPSYYPHAMMLNTIVARFKEQLERRDYSAYSSDSIDIWFCSIGLVASSGSDDYQWFVEEARQKADSLGLQSCEEAMARTRSILWLESSYGEEIFSPHWDAVLTQGVFVSCDL